MPAHPIDINKDLDRYKEKSRIISNDSYGAARRSADMKFADIFAGTIDGKNKTAQRT